MTQLTLEELIDQFEFLEDWNERYRFLIDLGRTLPALSPEERVEPHRVDGCQSQVWLLGAQESDGRWRFRADSDAHITKGLVALLVLAYSGRTRNEVLGFDEKGLFHRLGLDVHLSPLRSNGLHAMVRRIKALAASAA